MSLPTAVRWRMRDRRYAMSRNELTDGQIQSVREWRMKEAETLQQEEEARTWTPPPYFKFENERKHP